MNGNNSHKATGKKTKTESPRVGFQYLSPLLPSGFRTLFKMRRAGRYWGLTVECPNCHATPPRECDYGLRRWRWLAAHIASDHTT